MIARLPVPGLATPRKPRKVSTVERLLANGLTVVAVRRPSVPMVELRLSVPFFSTKPTHLARAMLLSASMLTGTGRHDRLGLAVAAGQLGAEINVSIDPDRLLISSSALATELSPLLELVAEVVTDARYPAAEVSGERSRLVERTRVSRSQAGTMAAEALAHRMLPQHPYGRTLPDEDQLAATTPAQLRAMHQAMVRPEGAVLVLVGDLSPARTLDAVERIFAEWTGAPAVSKPKPARVAGHGPLLVLDRPGSVQTSFRFGGAALPRTDPSYPALQLANLAFGGYFSSRWVENIREDKGYSYSPRSLLDHGALGSTFQVVADVATEVTAPAVLETLYELGRMAATRINPTELDSVQQYAIGSLALATSTQAGLAAQLSALASVGLGVDWLAAHPSRLLAVTVDEVAAAAARFLAPQRLVGVAVGDAGSITEPLAAIIDVE
ncbi:MAG TPA: pitrilysin family protein [Jatrophihabitans sp.]|nr:pitrilysin family protein [Jatrophihabitans sp.]